MEHAYLFRHITPIALKSSYLSSAVQRQSRYHKNDHHHVRESGSEVDHFTGAFDAVEEAEADEDPTDEVADQKTHLNAPHVTKGSHTLRVEA